MIEQSRIRKLLNHINEFGNYTLSTITGGKNNRAFLLDTEGNRYFLKEYFQDKHDTRDRLTCEYAFCTFAKSNDINSIAKPFACDPRMGLGLYEFIDGVNCNFVHATHQRIHEAAEFIKRINEHKLSSSAQKLGSASEACFSIEDHLRCVTSRVHRLTQIQPSTSVDRQAVEFSKESLNSSIRKIEENFSAADLLSEIPKEQYSLSPSDFGFHNMLIDTEGDLRFFDFEYAGWDDPAKMFCDFFCQPQIPISIDWMDTFIDVALSEEIFKDSVRYRTKLLYPLYRIKWCCIILNEFLPDGDRRRAFSNHADLVEDLKITKLNSAENYLNNSPMPIGKVI